MGVAAGRVEYTDLVEQVSLVAVHLPSGRPHAYAQSGLDRFVVLSVGGGVAGAVRLAIPVAEDADVDVPTTGLRRGRQSRRHRLVPPRRSNIDTLPPRSSIALHAASRSAVIPAITLDTNTVWSDIQDRSSSAVTGSAGDRSKMVGRGESGGIVLSVLSEGPRRQRRSGCVARALREVCPRCRPSTLNRPRTECTGILGSRCHCGNSWAWQGVPPDGTPGVPGRPIQRGRKDPT